VQRPGGGGEVEPALFLLDKGKKLLADLLALWPPPQVRVRRLGLGVRVTGWRVRTRGSASGVGTRLLADLPALWQPQVLATLLLLTLLLPLTL
jgi:hypothetical protein